jgi:maltooligosyltrehalose synthase
VWGDRRLAVPAGKWRNVLDDRKREVGAGGALVRELFEDLPVALLIER